MVKYEVKIYSRAYRDLDDIYRYIAEELLVPSIAGEIVDSLEKAIISLEDFPERGAVRKTGIYANRGYRQLFVRNYVIIYRIVKEREEVHVVTVQYMPRNF